MLGVYTHIVHDLTLVLADLAAAGRLGSVGDFHLANALIAETVPGSSARSVGATARGSPGSTGSAVSSTSC